MLDLFTQDVADIDVRPVKKLTAKVAGLFHAPADDFVTRRADALELTFDGIAGDFHEGATRRTGSREPWYKRGTEIRNERQLSIVSPEEMAIVVERMGMPEIKAEWIGANLLIEGIPHLSMLPSGTLLFFKQGGVTLKVDGQNHPCRLAGRSIGENSGSSEIQSVAMQFPKSAKRMRGLVAWVEKPGRIEAGEEISVRIPEQWIYG